MENAIPDWSKNCCRWFGYTATVFLYEFIGTFFLLCAVIATKGSAIGIGLMLFFLLLLGAPVTGAHYNPSVTIGVLINQGSSISLAKFVQAANMLAAQFIGGLLGMEFLYMCIVTKSAQKNITEFPTLKPEAAYWQSLFIEAMCTGLFVGANLLVKDEKAGFVGRSSSNVKDINGWMGCFTIASALTAMIFVAGPHSGASLNPAVSVALHCLKNQIMDDKHQEHYVFKVYMLGPLMGAVGAGVWSWAHRAMLAHVKECQHEAKLEADNEAAQHQE